MTKFIIVTGGVMSGIGKGVVSSSIGFLLKCSNNKVNMGKIDPYLNVDAGTMNPYEHGECFVLADGTETDLDLGCYERFLEQELTKESVITSGQIYRDVINQERKGDYLGKTIQVIPHVTNEIIRRIEQLKNIKNEDNYTTQADYVIVELGGTVGDLESDIYYNAFPQLYDKYGRNNVYHIHVVPLLQTLNTELKSKPAQQSISELNKRGIIPDIISLRLPNNLTNVPDDIMNKIQRIAYNSKLLLNPSCKSVYEVPFLLESQNILEESFGINMLNLKKSQTEENRERWNQFELLSKAKRVSTVKILIVGKYLYTDSDSITTDKSDAYISVRHAIDHAAFKQSGFLYTIDYLDLTNKSSFNEKKQNLNAYNAVILTGGFGKNGYNEMIEIAKLTRTHNIPTLGICLGFQMMVLEYARNVLGDKEAITSELCPDIRNNLIDIHRESDGEKINMGGTLRKGKYNITYSSMRDTTVEDYRFRHRYHLNLEYIQKKYNSYEYSGSNIIINNDLHLKGYAEDINAPTYLELKSHKCYIATQAHCELTSRVTTPSHMFSLVFLHI